MTQEQYGIDHWATGLNSANISVQRSLDQYTACMRVIEQLQSLIADPNADIGQLPVHQEQMLTSNGETALLEYPLDQQKHMAAAWLQIYEDRLAGVQARLIESWDAVNNVNAGVQNLLATARSDSQQQAAPQPPPPPAVASGVQVTQHS